MGIEFGYMSLRAKSVLLMAGATFALVQFFAQLFELQDIKIEVEQAHKFSSWDSVIYHNSTKNYTYSSGLNAANKNVSDLLSTNIEVSDEMVSGVSNVKDDSDPENIKFFGDTSDDDVDPEDEFPSNDFLEVNDNIEVLGVVKDNSSTLENSPEFELPASNYTSESDFSPGHDIVMGPDALPPSNLQVFSTSPENLDTNPSNFVNSTALSTSTKGKDAEDKLTTNESPKILKGELFNRVNDSSISKRERVYTKKRMVVPISKMNDMLLSSYASYEAVKPRLSSTVDRELRNVKSMIENAAIIEDSHFDVSLYRNFSAFKRSYELMEQVLKVYVYAEGEQPIFHQPRLKGIYASEGWFMNQLKSSKKVLTKNMKKAHLFYLPFSALELRIALYIPNSGKRKNLVQRLSDYVNTIKTKYDSWNRTDGADHFLVACHDWAPAETRMIMANCIRSLCNTDIKEGFRFGKDVSLPVTNVRSDQNPLRELGGKPSSQRRILAFFAGSMHGYLRPILLKYWENKDPDMKIFGPLPKVKGGMTYAQYMKNSKYCICAKGYQVHSPRVVEAIFYECVPVIISDNFVPPFFETLKWESFAVFVLEEDIPNLKSILQSISKRRYQMMQQRVKRVQQHFLWHSRPVKYDIFNMILHSIWHNRVFHT